MIEELFKRSAEKGIPDGATSITEWASRNRYLSSEDSATPGIYDPYVTPYIIEPQNAIGDPRVNEVVLMTSAQIAKTTLQLNVMGFYSDAEPSPIMFLMPTEDLCKLFSKKRLVPMVRDSPVLRECYLPESQQEMLEKKFMGGFVSMVGTNSPVKLSSQPIRIILGDELDRMERDVGGEGSPTALAKKRTTTFRNRKLVWTSTPTIKGNSPIEDLYEKSTREKYHVPCPHCNEFQILYWKNVKWEPDAPQDAWIVCEHCAGRIEDDHRKDMLAGGKWIAEKPFQGRRGFWLNQLYSPFVTIGETVLEFLDAKDDPKKLKVFVNTVLAETWEEGELPEVTGLDEHQEVYTAEIPEGVLLLVAGVDVQGDRLEVEIVGYGIDEESWSIAYHMILGDPNSKETWARLKAELTRTYRHEAGYGMRVSAVGIDTQGHHTKKVYDFCKKNANRRYLAMRGANIAGKPLISRPTRPAKERVRLYTVGTEAAKDAIYASLKVKERGANYCHFPKHYEAEYFAQLTAEKRVKKFEKGKSEIRYIKIRERNEAIDCRVYAYASLHWLMPNWDLLVYQNNEKRANLPRDSQSHDDFDRLDEVAVNDTPDSEEEGAVPAPKNEREAFDRHMDADEIEEEEPRQGSLIRRRASGGLMGSGTSKW